jgi:hypothetical protein
MDAHFFRRVREASMTGLLRRYGVALLSLAAVAVTASAVSAQVPLRQPVQGSFAYVNTNPFVGPGGLRLNQYAYNTAVLGRVTGDYYRQIPPYAMGYNPYPSPIISTGPVVPTSNYVPTGYNPYLGGSILATNPYAASGSVLATNPYYGGSDQYTTPYGSNPYVPYTDPYGGPLQGLAALTLADGQYLISVQRARQDLERAQQARIDTRRKLFDEIRYERMNTPTAEELRIKDIQTALMRARNDPPLTEIFNGDTLNRLFNHLATQQGKGIKGPHVVLDDEILKHINLTTGTGGNVGLLKADGKLTWPLPLQAPQYDAQRSIINANIAKAVEAVKYNNPVDRSTMKPLRDALDDLRRSLDLNIAAVSPSEYLESTRYLNMLDDAYKALQDPNVGNFFNQKWAPKGRTVAELVDNMAQVQGLKFAPATPGDEPYYNALYRALLTYDAGMVQLAGKP